MSKMKYCILLLKMIYSNKVSATKNRETIRFELNKKLSGENKVKGSKVIVYSSII
jgi:hypothetical protein